MQQERNFKQQCEKVAILETKFVVESSIFRDKLASYGIETILPNEAERNFIHATILNETDKSNIQ